MKRLLIVVVLLSLLAGCASPRTMPLTETPQPGSAGDQVVPGTESDIPAPDEPTEADNPSIPDPTASASTDTSSGKPTSEAVPVPTTQPQVLPTGPVRRPSTPEQMMAYITPDDPMVQLAMDDILNQRMQVFFTDFEELRDWVSWHIKYKSDQEVHGTPEYWQLPAETLRLGTGDCEDFAILLCSLMRAAGAPEDEVYVACGYTGDKTSGHGYLAEKWYTGLWQIVEPQAGVWSGMFMMDWATSVSYDTVFCFNDQSYITGLPTLPKGVYEFEVPASFYPMTSGAMVVYERYLRTGETVHASVEWMKGYAMVNSWSFNIWGPAYGPEATNKKAYTWSGKDLTKSFTFTPDSEGIYRVEILKWDALPRPVRLTIDPQDWEPWPGS